jgi:radical SAM peptide maturase (CXXX-repeat target family)/CXXX repeat peptide maturase
MESTKKILMGQLPDMWQEGLAKSITFSVTEECNLACKYCYMTGKNTKNKMSFETAKKAVDYILTNRNIFNEPSVIWEFVGGEPFVEIELIDKICDYIRYKMYVLKHPWFDSYRFSFSTNGLLYNTPKVQEYIKKNIGHLSVGISVDGNKIKHDMQRVKLDGSGSYDDVMKNVPLWIKQFPNSSTKATFSHDDIPYLKDSIISLWENGIKIVSANVVFEDVWHEGDDILFENQLKELGDYILDNELWSDYSVRFFDPNIGFPLTEEDKERNFCGAGKMLAIDYSGRYYPCLRFLDFTLNNKPGWLLGSVDTGINQDKIRPFRSLTLKCQSTPECIECPVAKGCAWCTGYNYDAADTDTIYQRATFLCKMHKANVRAVEYFWTKFTEKTGLVSPREEYRLKYQSDNSNTDQKTLLFITSDEATPHCAYRNNNKSKNTMSQSIVEKGLKFASSEGYLPVFLGKSSARDSSFPSIVDPSEIKNNDLDIAVCDNDIPVDCEGNIILLISRENINKISTLISKAIYNTKRINVILEDIDKYDKSDLIEYQKQLNAVKDLIIQSYQNDHTVEINLLTDILSLNSICDCGSGVENIALAPNGRFYLCPAFYFDNPDKSIGDLENGINIKNSHLLDIENAAVCSACDAYQCRRCKFLNKKLTNELNTPSHIQCYISHMERNTSRELQKELLEKGLITSRKRIQEVDYMDPYQLFTRREGGCTI